MSSPPVSRQNRADIAEILTKSIRTLSDGARIGLKIRVWQIKEGQDKLIAYRLAEIFSAAPKA
jgi:hypothetical protein